MNWYGFTKKDWIIYICCVIIIFAVCIFSGGCASTSSKLQPIGNIRESNAFILGKLAESVNEFDRGLSEATTKSRNITNEIDRIDYLFSEYERTALQLRDEVDNLRKQIQNKDENNISAVNNNSTSYNVGGVVDNFTIKGD